MESNKGVRLFQLGKEVCHIGFGFCRYSTDEMFLAPHFEKMLYDKVKSVMSNWNEDGIYAISFFVYSNEAYEFKNFTNVSTWAISYNTEADCEGAGPLDEERWNYAFWRQDETSIIDIDEPDECTEALYKWYAEQGIENIGFEDVDNMYDEEYNYIGKGPVGEKFYVNLLGREFAISHPDYAIRATDGGLIPPLPCQTFLLRYLLESKAVVWKGTWKTFREMPWGETYMKAFSGRALGRAAFAFGSRLAVIDPAGGAQPMTAAQGGEVVVQRFVSHEKAVDGGEILVVVDHFVQTLLPALTACEGGIYAGIPHVGLQTQLLAPAKDLFVGLHAVVALDDVEAGLLRLHQTLLGEKFGADAVPVGDGVKLGHSRLLSGEKMKNEE